MDEDTLSQSQSQAAQCKRPQLKRTKPREYMCVEVKVLNSNNVQVEMESSNIIFSFLMHTVIPINMSW